MFFLMNEAVMVFSPFWSPLPKSYQKKMHLDIHSYTEVAFFFGFGLAFTAIYINKEQNGKPHFKSWHGFLGLIQAGLMLCQVSLGTLAKYARLLPFKLNAGRLKTLHGLLGSSVLILTAANMVTSCFTNFYASQTTAVMPYLFSAIFLAIYGFVSFHVLSTNSRILSLFSVSSKKQSKK